MTYIYNGESNILYIDGIPTKSNKPADQNITINTIGKVLHIGESVNKQYRFKGSIDEVRIYNRALSNLEVADLYELEKPRPIITSQPQSGSYLKGSGIVVKVGIDDFYESPVIKWFKNGQHLPGENSAELTIINADEKNGGDYYALISAGGKAETSKTAKVTILSLPEITALSENTVADEGETIQLTVSADGTAPLSYKWKKVEDDFILSTSSNLVLKNVDEEDAGSYIVVVSSQVGEVTSPAIIVGIRPDTDNDGLLDHVEEQLGTNLEKPDTDDDGLSDFAEVKNHKTNPLLADSDGDGLPDGVELLEGFDPLVGTEAADGSLTVHTAIELEFFTLKSQNYVLQSSTDLKTWKDETSTFQGKGGFYSLLASTREKQNSFWRLKVVE